MLSFSHKGIKYFIEANIIAEPNALIQLPDGTIVEATGWEDNGNPSGIREMRVFDAQINEKENLTEIFRGIIRFKTFEERDRFLRLNTLTGGFVNGKQSPIIFVDTKEEKRLREFTSQFIAEVKKR